MGVVARLIALVVGRLKAMKWLEWIGIAAVVDQIVDSAFVKGINKFIADEIAEASGVVVHPDRLWSAVGWSEGISARLGLPLRDISDPVKVREDVLSAAAGMIREKSGVELTDLSDPEQIRKDVIAYGVGRFALDSGIVLTDPLDVEAVKADLITWGKQQAMATVSDDLAGSALLQDGDGLRLMQLLAARGVDGISPKELMGHARGVLLGYVAEEYERAKPYEKLNRKRLLNREAQAKFRREHGKRDIYVPLGWSSVLSPPPPPEVPPP